MRGFVFPILDKDKEGYNVHYPILGQSAGALFQVYPILVKDWTDVAVFIESSSRIG